MQAFTVMAAAQHFLLPSLTFSFATTIVVSCLLAGCRVDASASRPLDSASALSTPRRLLSA